MGKGSKQRPTDQKKFNDNYDMIFGKPSVRKGTQAIDTQVHVDKKKETKRQENI